MHILHKKNFSKLGLDTRVPDETLERDTKPLLGDEGRTRKDDLTAAADAAFSDRLKRDIKNG
jgi:hypothetical protein